MNLNNIKTELAYHAALLCFNVTYIEEIKELCNELMNQGIFCDIFLEIDDSNTLADFIPPFKSLLKELEIVTPANPDEAIWILLRYHLEPIATGEKDPLEGLGALMREAYWNYDFHSKTKEYIGDSHGIESLVGLYWGYDDMLEQIDEYSDKAFKEKTIEVKDEIIKSAKTWLKIYGQP